MIAACRRIDPSRTAVGTHQRGSTSQDGEDGSQRGLPPYGFVQLPDLTDDPSAVILAIVAIPAMVKPKPVYPSREVAGPGVAPRRGGVES